LVIVFGVANSGARGSPFLPHDDATAASIITMTHSRFI
jgi:hypothetical protein